ncbi:rRNA maturation RNase YbeY [Paraflavitalea sp. CAU 1676]|uniref:rRNA maturation RNase YbeY n=1 Tax=Paraflavitalea sp. CAU 1676 TaxID=3032598 RepID=UPI0023DC8A62|nr:rRNA maturation RNase YbeY [Paraflavitalea sp. CAU 1676]MDF2191030.1 rRNA maturation RNase YbeY [Paraflavitalea sp. CAU 1676]
MATLASVDFHFLEPATLRNRTALKKFLRALFRREGTKLEGLRYIFCSDEYLLEINRQYLKHDYYTDIITFNLADKKGPVNGEIYISIDRVKDNAIQFDSSLTDELHRVILHGALHLCGYKDKSKKEEEVMRSMETKYLDRYKKAL